MSLRESLGRLESIRGALTVDILVAGIYFASYLPLTTYARRQDAGGRRR